MELLLKRASDSNFITLLNEQASAIQRLPSERILEPSIDYALQVGKGKPEEIIETFLAIYPSFKDTIMTAARQLEKRGEIKGRELGMQQEKLTIARNLLLQLHLDIETVEKATELSKKELEAILEQAENKR